jgi:hypothetical protein
MSAEQLRQISSVQAFGPRTRLDELAHDHVPFDELVGIHRYERQVLELLGSGEPRGVAVIGGRGAGKSSLIAHVCDRLPDGLLQVRVPVAGEDDPASTSVIASLALDSALRTVKGLAGHQRAALERSRANERTARRAPRWRITLGGGAIPAKLDGELQSLEEQLRTTTLAQEHLAGLDRLIDILVARDVAPVFVIEDTEALIGASDDGRLAEQFFNGPVRAMVREVQAPLLLAVQTDIAAGSPTFADLVPNMLRVDLPHLDHQRAPAAFRAIAQRRLDANGLAIPIADVLGEDAVTQLIGWYDETERSVRLTLAVLASATDRAADANAQRIDAGHVRVAAADWRNRHVA